MTDELKDLLTRITQKGFTIHKLDGAIGIILRNDYMDVEVYFRYKSFQISDHYCTDYYSTIELEYDETILLAEFMQFAMKAEDVRLFEKILLEYVEGVTENENV